MSCILDLSSALLRSVAPAAPPPAAAAAAKAVKLLSNDLFSVTVGKRAEGYDARFGCVATAVDSLLLSPPLLLQLLLLALLLLEAEKDEVDRLNLTGAGAFTLVVLSIRLKK